MDVLFIVARIVKCANTLLEFWIFPRNNRFRTEMCVQNINFFFLKKERKIHHARPLRHWGSAKAHNLHSATCWSGGWIPQADTADLSALRIPFTNKRSHYMRDTHQQITPTDNPPRPSPATCRSQLASGRDAVRPYPRARGIHYPED